MRNLQHMRPRALALASAVAVAALASTCGDTDRLGGDGGVRQVDAADPGDASDVGDSDTARIADADTADLADAGVPGDPTRIHEGVGPTCALALDGDALLGVTVGSTTEAARLWRLGGDEPVALADASSTDTFASSSCLLTIGFGAAWWQAPFAPGLWRTDLATGETRSVHATGVSGVAVGAGHAWWTVHDDYAVYRALPSGADAARFADVDTPTGIVASEDRVWVMDRLGSTLLTLDPNTGATEYFTSWLGDNTMTLALGPNDLVWPSHSSNLLHAIAIEGGDVRTIGEASSGPLAVTAQYAYTAPGPWDFTRELLRVPLDGTPSDVLAEVAEECAVGLAANEAGAWWTDCAGAVWRGR